MVGVRRIGTRAPGARGLQFRTGGPRGEVGDPGAQALQPPPGIGEVGIFDWGVRGILDGDVAEKAAKHLEYILDLHLGRVKPADVLMAVMASVLGSEAFASHGCMEKKLVDCAVDGYAKAAGVGILDEALKKLCGLPKGFHVAVR